MTAANVETRRPPLPGGEVNRNPQGIGYWRLVGEDYRTHDRQFFSQGFWAVFWHRFGNWRMSVRPKLLRAPLTLIYRFMFKATEIFCGVMLPYSVPLGRRVKIEHFGGIIISARGIGDDVVIRQNTTIGVASVDDVGARPAIGARVDIGAGACILGDITVGDDAVIGANAVVIDDVPPRAVVGGVPAKLIRMRNDTAPG